MTRRRPALLLLLALAAVQFTPASDSWPGFRGPRGTGEAAALPAGDGSLGLQLVWRRPLGSGYAGIAVAEGALVTAGGYGEKDYVVALDPATGAERWRAPLGPAHKGHDGSHDGPISTPAIAGGRVFALGAAGQLVALDLASGKELWRVHLVDDLGSEKPFYDFGSSPLVVDGTVILQIGGEAGAVAGFDAGTGALRWRVVEDQIATESPILAEMDGRRQVLVLGNTYLTGLDPATGAILWQHPHEGGRGISSYSSPIPLGDGRVFVQHGSDATAVVGVTRTEEGSQAQVVQTSRGLTKSYSPPARSGGHLYGYTARFLSAVDPASGEVLWRSREPGDGFLIAIGDQLAVLTKEGSLHLGPASPGGWQETARLELFEELAWTPPSYAGGAIYARSLGEIARVDLKRAPRPERVQVARQELPAPLKPLVARVARAEDPRKDVDRFLKGRDLPLVQGEEVVFIWRGEARDVAIAGDMIGMRREEPMQRLKGTDLWWWATPMDRRARVSYVFYVNDEPRVDPAHDQRTVSTVLGPDRNWNRGEPMPMSWFAMPGWPGWKHSAVLAAGADAARDGGRLESFSLTVQPPAREDGAGAEGAEAPEPVAVTLQVWLPPGYEQAEDRYPTLYLADENALEVGAWPATLDRVVGRSVAPLIVVFTGRQQIPDWNQVVVDQVVPAVDGRYRTRAGREHRALVGMGWGGLVAASTAFANTKAFGVLGVQSLYGLDSGMNWFRESLGEATAEDTPMRIYFEWGRWDLISPHENMNMRASARAVWDLLGERGYAPAGGEVWDSTDWASWRHRTHVLLQSLFPMPGAKSLSTAWTTARTEAHRP